MLLLLANLTYGLLFGDFNAEANRLREAHHRLDEIKHHGPPTDDAELAEAKAHFAEVSRETRGIRRHAEYHKLLGLAAAVVTVLVNSISVTYFIGTSRWCQEVVDTYRLSTEFIALSKQLKRGTFPWSLLGILTILLISGLGAASDPLNSLANAGQWVNIHLMVAIGGVAIIGWSFFRQLANVQANLALISSIMSEVQKMRDEKQLDSDSPATLTS